MCRSWSSFQDFSLWADERAQVGYYRTVEAFADLVPIGILGGESLSGVVPVLVVNSLLVPSVLSTPQASEDPLKSILPILMSRGSARRFVAFASENTGPALRNYPHRSLVLDGGGGHHSSFFPHLPARLAVLTLFLISPSNLSRFLWVTFTREQLGKWLAEEDIWENAPEQAITFDKAIVPAGEGEESRRIRAFVGNVKCHARGSSSLIPAC